LPVEEFIAEAVHYRRDVVDGMAATAVGVIEVHPAVHLDRRVSALVAEHQVVQNVHVGERRRPERRLHRLAFFDGDLLATGLWLAGGAGSGAVLNNAYLGGDDDSSRRARGVNDDRAGYRDGVGHGWRQHPDGRRLARFRDIDSRLRLDFRPA